jgi:hypothetical protein
VVNGRQVSSRCVRGRPRGLGWTDLAEGRLCLDRLPAMAVHRLSSLARPGHPTRIQGTANPPGQSLERIRLGHSFAERTKSPETPFCNRSRTCPEHSEHQHLFRREFWAKLVEVASHELRTNSPSLSVKDDAKRLGTMSQLAQANRTCEKLRSITSI